MKEEKCSVILALEDCLNYLKEKEHYNKMNKKQMKTILLNIIARYRIRNDGSNLENSNNPVKDSLEDFINYLKNEEIKELDEEELINLFNVTVSKYIDN